MFQIWLILKYVEPEELLMSHITQNYKLHQAMSPADTR